MDFKLLRSDVSNLVHLDFHLSEVPSIIPEILSLISNPNSLIPSDVFFLEQILKKSFYAPD